MLKMLFPNGLKKAFTTSYDDGLYDDLRLMELMKKHGIKGTFNVSSALYRPEGSEVEGSWPRFTLSEAVENYKKYGVEVAVHGLCHRDFTQLNQAELNYEIAADRANLEMQYGCVVRGAAYPYGSFNDAAVEVLRANGIKYCRTVGTVRTLQCPRTGSDCSQQLITITLSSWSSASALLKSRQRTAECFTFGDIQLSSDAQTTGR